MPLSAAAIIDAYVHAWRPAVPPAVELDANPVMQVQRPAFPDPVPDGEVRATWLGHASVLFQLDGARVLCDPIFSERCSPSQYFGPKRYRPAPCQVADLPPLDAVMISHTHYDHLDYGSVLALHARFPELQWFVPRGCKSWMQACGPQHVQELTWWEEAPLGDRKDFRVVFTPTQHWSGRGAFDRNRVRWFLFPFSFRFACRCRESCPMLAHVLSFVGQ